MTAAEEPLKPGALIRYDQVTPGGYGFVSHVPGEFLRHTAHRVQILVYTKAGTTKIINVRAHNIRRRGANEPWR